MFIFDKENENNNDNDSDNDCYSDSGSVNDNNNNSVTKTTVPQGGWITNDITCLIKNRSMHSFLSMLGVSNQNMLIIGFRSDSLLNSVRCMRTAVCDSISLL